MIDLSRETGSNNQICLGIRFCLAPKALQLFGVEQ